MIMACLVALVWSAVFLNAYVFNPGAEKPPAEFSGPMVFAMTWLFGSSIKDLVKRNNGNGKKEPTSGG